MLFVIYLYMLFVASDLLHTVGLANLTPIDRSFLLYQRVSVISHCKPCPPRSMLDRPAYQLARLIYPAYPLHFIMKFS